MKTSLHFILAFGVLLAFASFALTEEIDDVQPETILESRSGASLDKVSPRVHALLAGHHHHLHALHGFHAHHGLHGHHAHHLLHHAAHHPILTKKLLLLKFKGLGLAHHHHLHHPHAHHHLLHHGLFHHHHLRATQGVGSDSGVVEVFPVSDPTGAIGGVTTGLNPSNIQLVDDSPTVQAYAVPSDYLQGITDTPDDSELENYEEIGLEELPETTPNKKHLVSAEGVYDQAPIYLYAVPQQVELGRSAPRINKNRKKFKN